MQTYSRLVSGESFLSPPATQGAESRYRLALPDWIVTTADILKINCNVWAGKNDHVSSSMASLAVAAYGCVNIAVIYGGQARHLLCHRVLYAVHFAGI
jgi:hypothetical protein